MSEFRRDPITGRWTVIAENRMARPNEYGSAAPSPASNCPFCAGHESWTPPEVAAYGTPGRAPNGPGWTVRTIPNKFPTLAPDAGSPHDGVADPGLARRPGFGYHEVVVESPEHVPLFPYLGVDRAREVLTMVRARLRVLSSTPGVASLVAFENSGPESGGTLFHPHAQIVALPEVPPRLAEEAEAAARVARSRGGGCLFETVLDDERRAATRVIADTAEIAAYAPFASEHPYEVRLVPHRHSGSLAEATDQELGSVAELLPAVLRALRAIVPDASYNFVARSFAGGRAESATYHWHVDVLPRLVRPDGFEVGVGIAVNPVSPEAAAEEIRAALASDADGPARPKT